MTTMFGFILLLICHFSGTGTKRDKTGQIVLHKVGFNGTGRDKGIYPVPLCPANMVKKTLITKNSGTTPP